MAIPKMENQHSFQKPYGRTRLDLELDIELDSQLAIELNLIYRYFIF